ncbi:MAG: SPFH/Band 7/PHB domain protein [Victivallales bacterium]|nr:SPFH/Band 7/PHB domain protein [Victivallales bacterium]
MVPFLIVVAFIVIVALAKSIYIVPQKHAYIVERLGQYTCTLNAGFHLLVPFIDTVRYKQNLKEKVIDIPPQQCITKDNIMVSVDGILYLTVTDPVKASYGIDNYLFACAQLAQTTLRSEIGKLELDRTFEERNSINGAICQEVDQASDPWGVKVTRYEIKTITPPASVLDAMEKQMRAEREKRASIAESEGQRDSKINRSEGEKQEAIRKSEGEKARRINEAEGRAKEISLIAEATANGLATIAKVLSSEPGAHDALNLRIAEQYISEFGKLAKTSNTLVIPADLSNIASIVKVATTALSNTTATAEAPTTPPALPRR